MRPAHSTPHRTARPARALFALALIACGAAPVHAPAPRIGEAIEIARCALPEGGDATFVDLDACLGGELAEAAATVRAALSSPVVPVDLARLFTEDGELVFARLPAAGPHDLVLGHAAMSARNAFFSETSGGIDPSAGAYESGFGAVEVEREGDLARLRGTHLEVYFGGEEHVDGGVTAELVRIEGAWRIRRLRTWPIDELAVDAGGRFDAEEWAARDRAVDVARAAVAASAEPEARRLLVEALARAARLVEALEALGPLLAGAPNVDDLNALAHLEALRGRAEPARAALQRARDPATPIRTLAGSMRRDWCTSARVAPADPDEDEGAETRCTFEVLAELPLEGPDVRAVGVVRTITGVEGAEALHLLVHTDGAWARGPRIAAGPIAGRAGDGPRRLTAADPRLVELDDAPPPELQMRYERESVEGDVVVTEAGVLVCLARPREDGACALVPERVERTANGRTQTSEYDVAFEGGELQARLRRGPPAPGVWTGRRAIHALGR
ncbi:MAG: hypothetical protein KF729_17550 [Sandaracinaceae bacterium]|nr:hypothetical protein [Sandaracinaceae bacterium]